MLLVWHEGMGGGIHQTLMLVFTCGTQVLKYFLALPTPTPKIHLEDILTDSLIILHTCFCSSAMVNVCECYCAPFLTKKKSPFIIFFLDFPLRKNPIFPVLNCFTHERWKDEMWGNFTKKSNKGWNYEKLFLPNSVYIFYDRKVKPRSHNDTNTLCFILH